MADQEIMQEIMATVKKLPPESLGDVLAFLKTLVPENGGQGDDDAELLTMDRQSY